MLNTILGSFSSGVAASTSSYESIATVTVGSGGSSSVSFSSIPSTYAHLQIRMIGRGTMGAWTYLKINGDATSGNYIAHELGGNGSSAFSNVYTGSVKGMNLFTTYGLTSVFTGAVIDILDYTSTNKTKTVRALNGWDGNGSGETRLQSGLYFATPAAITSITFTPDDTYQQYTQFALYGIKGA